MPFPTSWYCFLVVHVLFNSAPHPTKCSQSSASTVINSFIVWLVVNALSPTLSARRTGTSLLFTVVSAASRPTSLPQRVSHQWLLNECLFPTGAEGRSLCTCLFWWKKKLPDWVGLKKISQIPGCRDKLM